VKEEPGVAVEREPPLGAKIRGSVNIYLFTHTDTPVWVPSVLVIKGEHGYPRDQAADTGLLGCTVLTVPVRTLRLSKLWPYINR
jgi:hypothetical protein